MLAAELGVLPLIKTILYIGQNRLFFAVVNYAHRAIGENRFYFDEILPPVQLVEPKRRAELESVKNDC